jgi:hypothetical protein
MAVRSRHARPPYLWWRNRCAVCMGMGVCVRMCVHVHVCTHVCAHAMHACARVWSGLGPLRMHVCVGVVACCEPNARSSTLVHMCQRCHSSLRASASASASSRGVALHHDGQVAQLLVQLVVIAAQQAAHVGQRLLLACLRGMAVCARMSGCARVCVCAVCRGRGVNMCGTVPAAGWTRCASLHGSRAQAVVCQHCAPEKVQPSA